ncbi:Aldehyde/histidinol dehydrogenase [Aspergillus arachidicola]|uniref:Aldehyde/histidinol dehydrogenase n=1 Tax=Aspergillus arachidicola TaxID=656916 RepID=A0A5N6Y5E3_9EURO|nr:Aldehyde/histidinol dehydrogenase [Aspergillus arachidicola]
MRPLTLTRAAGLNWLKSHFLSYAIESPERAELSETIQKMKAEFPATIPIRINGLEIEMKQSRSQVNPSRHKDIVANYAMATPDQVNTAVDATLKANPAWEATPFESRAVIFLRACELIAGKYRSEMVAATMLGQGKNIWQAGIDALTETVDFFRYYVQEAWALSSQQPKVHPDGNWNKLEYRPLEGFTYAIAPFNFRALGATLLARPRCLETWSSGSRQIRPFTLVGFSTRFCWKLAFLRMLFNFLPGDAEEVTNTILKRPEFSALTFIGSTATFKSIQKKIGDGIGQGIYNSYPRVVGETGRKNWGVVHLSADGQKCSANSRVYVAELVWLEFQRHLKKETEALKVGGVEDYGNFVNPVIHERSFDKLNEFIEAARTDSELELITGGKASKEKGYYVHPTIYKTSNPRHNIMKRELLGPILGVYVHPDAEWEEVLKLIDTTCRYSLTGSIYAKDPYASSQAQTALKHAAGMLYLNTKCTNLQYNVRLSQGSKANVDNHIKLEAQEGWSLGIKLVRGAAVVCCKSFSSKDFQVFDVGICG